MTLLACLLLAATDPKPTADYVADLLSDLPGRQPAAIEALKARPDDAKPVALALVKLVVGTDVKVADRASAALYELGPVAKDALPALKELAKAHKEDGRVVGAILAVSNGADRDAVRRFLPERSMKSQSPYFNEYVIDRYAAGLAGPLTDILATDPDAAIRADAATALGHYATSVRKDGATPLPRAGEAGKKVAPALEAALKDADAAVRRAAVLSLMAVEPAATARVLPVVVDMLKADRLTRYNVSGVLKPHATTAVPVLVSALTGDDATARERIAGVLAELRESAIPLLLPSVKHADARVRCGVVRALGTMWGVDEAVTPSLVEALADADPDVRLTAAEGLTLGQKVKKAAAVPVLVAALGGDSAAARKRAAFALRPVGAAAKPAVPALLKALGDQDGDTALFAARSLAAIDPPSAGPAVPVMADRGLAGELRSAVAQELGRLGPTAKAALPKLTAMFQDANAAARSSAAVAAVRIDPTTADAAIAALTGLLGAESKKVPTAERLALKGLRELGPAAKSAVPALERRLMTARDDHRWQVAATLLAIDPTHAAAVGVLRKELATGDTGSLDEVVSSVHGLGAAVAALVPDLIPFLAHKDSYARGTAAALLGEIGPAAKAALPALRAQLPREQGKYAKERIEKAVQAIGGK